MESGVDFPSPESTVTSLLSSSGHLRSSLLAPEHNTTFRYRDKIYDSASAALDAYITDFERSRQNSGSLTGSLVLPRSRPSTPSRPRASTLRNKDVLRERLTERELDFLNLPVSSLHHRGNRDRLSMTTDELLSIPYDGSMPVTHTSAFIHGLLSQSGAPQPFSSSSRPAHRTWDRPSSSHAAPHLNHHHPHPTRTPRSSRCRERPGTVMFNPDVDISSVSYYRQSAHRAARSEWAEPSSSLHLPRWFTSNKSDMDCSGITSVPDLEYPAWVQRCDLSEPPPSSESEPWDDHGTTPPARHQHCQAPRTPSWVAELEDDDPDHKPKQVDSQQTLRDLRLQFAEQISLLAAERNTSDIMETLSRDNRLESLIQKADQVLNSLSQSSGEADPGSPADCVEEAVSPANTEELLLCSSSHCRPFTRDFATAAAGGGITEALTDINAQAQGSGLHRNSILKQPGPVEALKQMLFRLQAVEAEVQRQTQASVAPTISNKDGWQTEKTPEKQRPESEAELESFPGGPSLQRAMHHLSRLKVLVEEREKKHTEKEEEKDEDEGRYSSSSAEGLNCIRQSPT
ncbi:lung adenoma susceptibility protein 2 isoform X1 [Sander lucioperca]|uniref:Lung adenoma susceptibility protein 2 n=1 Tax=Sander lucioperca TaxID=283035 RepID=A0A8C9ZTC7_SANLU|nr:lung adenoma susceptibility protein 2 isoform X1 [Sander lucioperca]XP_031143142.1 lung adenoma susceptibility protein 2 isoform X1 [Sander lucioperca]